LPSLRSLFSDRLLGQKSSQPFKDTSYNFIRTIPLVLVLWLLNRNAHHWTESGLVYALLSGVLASGLGYSLWYIAIKQISTSMAAASQLMVPLLAGLGGFLILAEQPNHTFYVSALLILGGIGVISWAKS